MSYTYSLAVPGTLYRADSYALIECGEPPQWTGQRMKDDDAVLAIANGTDERADWTWCLAHRRADGSPVMGWIKNEDLRGIDSEDS